MTGTIRQRKRLDETGQWDSVPQYFIDNVEVTEDEYRQHFKPAERISFMCSAPGIWPLRSEALAVHPDQIGEATVSAIKRGVATDFDRSGAPIFRTRGHRTAYMKAYGFHDKDGGYGDAQPANKRKRIIPKPVERDPKEPR
jgi:hypothetical protein